MEVSVDRCHVRACRSETRPTPVQRTQDRRLAVVEQTAVRTRRQVNESESGLRQRTARGLKWRTVEIVGHHSLSFVVFAVLARLLRPEDFGLLAIVAIYVAFINILVDQGMSTALVQREPLQP